MLQLNHRIPKACSVETEAQGIANSLRGQLGADPFSAIFFFASGHHNLPEIGNALSKFYPDCPVIGSTTSGVIDANGYNDDGVCAFGLPQAQFSIETEIISPISQVDMAKWRSQTRDLIKRLDATSTTRLADHTFAFLLVDGLSLSEETVLSAIYPELGDIPLFGGSAGDDLEFKITQIYCNGVSMTDGAALVLINTTCPFTVFRTQHFVQTNRKMVITDADPLSRIVHEINASPATEEYARLIGVPTSELTPLTYAKHPVMVQVGGQYFARSIQRQEGEDALRFSCAIDNGLVLTLAEGKDLIANLRETMQGIHRKIGKPELVIGCDCVFRKLELEQKGGDKLEQVSEIFRNNNVYGFNTYGEQFHGMHVNQTFTGVAIGWPHD